LERRVSAGWEMMAEATPATTPEASEMLVLTPYVSWSGVLPIDLYMVSAAADHTHKTHHTPRPQSDTDTPFH
jgi:hypothetical protein